MDKSKSTIQSAAEQHPNLSSNDLSKNLSCSNCISFHHTVHMQKQNILALKRFLKDCSTSLSLSQEQVLACQTEIHSLKEQLWLSENKVNNLTMDNSTLKEQLNFTLNSKSENRDVQEKLQSAQSMADCYQKQLDVLRNVNEQLLLSMQQINKVQQSQQSTSKSSGSSDELLQQKEMIASLRNQLLHSSEESDKSKKELKIIRERLNVAENKNNELLKEINEYKTKEKSVVDTLTSSLIRSKHLSKKQPYLSRLCKIFQVSLDDSEELDLDSIINDSSLDIQEANCNQPLSCEISPEPQEESRKRFQSVYEFVTKLYGLVAANEMKNCFEFVKTNECIPPLDAGENRLDLQPKTLKRKSCEGEAVSTHNESTEPTPAKVPRTLCNSDMKENKHPRKSSHFNSKQINAMWVTILKSYKSSQDCKILLESLESTHLKFDGDHFVNSSEILLETIVSHLYCEWKNSVFAITQVQIKKEPYSYQDRKPYISQLETYCFNISQAMFNMSKSKLSRDDILSLIYRTGMKRVHSINKELNRNKHYIAGCVSRFIFSLVISYLNLKDKRHTEYLSSLVCDLIANISDCCIVILTSLIMTVPQFFDHLFQERSDFLPRTLECLMWSEISHSRSNDNTVFLNTFKLLSHWSMSKQPDITKAPILIEDIAHQLMHVDYPKDSAWKAISLLSSSQNTFLAIHSFVKSHILPALMKLQNPVHFTSEILKRTMQCCQHVCLTYSCANSNHSALLVSLIKLLNRLIVVSNSPLKLDDQITVLKTLLKIGFLEPSLSGATFLFWLEHNSQLFPDSNLSDMKSLIYSFLNVYSNYLTKMKAILNQLTLV